MFTVDAASAGDDAPPRSSKPRQPRPFLKRGEGVNKRLNAYKLREQAEELRKERSSSTPTSSAAPIKESTTRPNTSDQFAAAAGAGAYPNNSGSTSHHHSHQQQHRRSTWHKQADASAVVAGQELTSGVGESRQRQAAPETASDQDPWTSAGQDVEVGGSGCQWLLRWQSVCMRLVPSQLVVVDSLSLVLSASALNITKH